MGCRNARTVTATPSSSRSMASISASRSMTLRAMSLSRVVMARVARTIWLSTSPPIRDTRLVRRSRSSS